MKVYHNAQLQLVSMVSSNPVRKVNLLLSSETLKKRNLCRTPIQDKNEAATGQPGQSQWE